MEHDTQDFFVGLLHPPRGQEADILQTFFGRMGDQTICPLDAHVIEGQEDCFISRMDRGRDLHGTAVGCTVTDHANDGTGHGGQGPFDDG